MFDNAKHYNAEGSNVYLDAETLQVSVSFVESVTYNLG